MTLKEMIGGLWDNYQPIRNYNYNIPVGLHSYYLIHTELEWEGLKVWNFCNRRWTYIPKKGNRWIEFSLWKKAGLCKVRIDCEAPIRGYKYQSYYGTKLISKSNNILHAVKELIKYKE